MRNLIPLGLLHPMATPTFVFSGISGDPNVMYNLVQQLKAKPIRT